MTVDVSEAVVEPPSVVEPRRHPWKIVLIVAALVVALVAVWAYSYNPLAQSWQQTKGEFGSYVGTTSGVSIDFICILIAVCDRRYCTQTA